MARYQVSPRLRGPGLGPRQRPRWCERDRPPRRRLADSSTAPRSAQGPPTPAFNAGPPDLFISRVSLQPDGRISVTVGNRGPGDLLGYSVFVTVRDLGSRSEQLMTPVG